MPPRSRGFDTTDLRSGKLPIEFSRHAQRGSCSSEKSENIKCVITSNFGYRRQERGLITRSHPCSPRNQRTVLMPGAMIGQTKLSREDFQVIKTHHIFSASEESRGPKLAIYDVEPALIKKFPPFYLVRSSMSCFNLIWC